MKPFSRAPCASSAAAAEREPEPELAADLLAEPAPGQVVAGERAGLASPRGSARRRTAASSSSASSRLRRSRAARPRRARPPRTRAGSRARSREPLDRADEVEPLRLADEADHVAALVAAVAVVELVDRVDREARRALLVERAAADEAGARTCEAASAPRRRRRSPRSGVPPRRCVSLIRAISRAGQRSRARSGRSSPR